MTSHWENERGVMRAKLNRDWETVRWVQGRAQATGPDWGC